MIADIFGGGRGIGMPTAQSGEDTRPNAENYQDKQSIDHSFSDPIRGDPAPSTSTSSNRRNVRSRTRTPRRNLPIQQKGSDRYEFPQ